MQSIKLKQILRASLALLFISTALLLFNACTSVPIHDAEWCGDEGADGASCFHFLTSDHRDLDKSDWDDLRFGQVCTSIDSFADVKNELEKLCSTTQCSYETKQAIARFFSTLDALKSESN